MAQAVSSFVAHAGATTCMGFGPGSGRVLASGGADQRVNLWAVGRSSPILSLAGHSSPVECVALDWPEELVVAGAASGILKLWDLEHGKVIRTLSGHRSSASCVKFHPFGDFFASGSTDLSVKLWDVRRKGCIQTYQGHQGTVCELQITPDGRWIASSSQDGTVKIWDMTAGKLLHTITSTSGWIKSLAFSPNEFILATASTAGFAHIYDLQSFDCLGTSSQLIGKPVKSVFDKDGQMLITATDSTLEAWRWDASSNASSHISTNWSNIVDFTLLSDHRTLLACTVEKNFAEILKLDYGLLRQTLEVQDHPMNSIKQDQDSKKRAMNHVDVSMLQDMQVDDPTFEHVLDAKPTTSQTVTIPSISNTGARNTPQETHAQQKRKASAQQIQRDAVLNAPEAVQKSSPMITQSSLSSNHPRPMSQLQHTDDSLHQQREKQSSVTRVSTTENNGPSVSYIPACDGNRTLNLDLARFIKPSHGGQIQPMPLGLPDLVTTTATDADVIDSLLARHASMGAILSKRLAHLQHVRDAWSEGNPKLALDTTLGLHDNGALVDFLRILNLKPKLLTLEMAANLLPSLCELLFEMYEDYIQCACMTARLIHRSFATMISDTLEIGNDQGNNIDISFEDRFKRCTACHQGLTQFSNILSEMRKYRGKLGELVRETLSELGH